MAHVQTDLGPIEPGAPAFTLPHEHTQIALWHLEITARGANVESDFPGMSFRPTERHGATRVVDGVAEAGILTMTVGNPRRPLAIG